MVIFILLFFCARFKILSLKYELKMSGKIVRMSYCMRVWLEVLVVVARIVESCGYKVNRKGGNLFFLRAHPFGVCEPLNGFKYIITVSKVVLF